MGRLSPCGRRELHYQPRRQSSTKQIPHLELASTHPETSHSVVLLQFQRFDFASLCVLRVYGINQSEWNCRPHVFDRRGLHYQFRRQSSTKQILHLELASAHPGIVQPVDLSGFRTIVFASAYALKSLRTCLMRSGRLFISHMMTNMTVRTVTVSQSTLRDLFRRVRILIERIDVMPK